MPVLPAPTHWTHELPNARFRSLATPSRGTCETSIWRVSITPGVPGHPHSVTREEIFVVLSGVAQVTFDGAPQIARPGDAIVVPAHVEFTLLCGGDEPTELLCCLPVGGQAQLVKGEPFTPPWAQ